MQASEERTDHCYRVLRFQTSRALCNKLYPVVIHEQASSTWLWISLIQIHLAVISSHIALRSMNGGIGLAIIGSGRSSTIMSKRFSTPGEESNYWDRHDPRGIFVGKRHMSALFSCPDAYLGGEGAYCVSIDCAGPTSSLAGGLGRCSSVPEGRRNSRLISADLEPLEAALWGGDTGGRLVELEYQR
nr:hypothetical protein CFP56_03151 [Quercus suber]